MASKHEYYLPHGAHDFLGWNRNFLEVLSVNMTAWNIQSTDVTPLSMVSAELEQALAKAESETASKEDIRAKNTALKKAQDLFRFFVNSKINYNEAVTPDDRANLRVHVRDTTQTAIPVPADHVRMLLRPLPDHCLRFDFTSAATGKKAIPYGMNGVVVCWKILEDGEQVPARGEELPESELITSSPHVFEYSPDKAGKRAAFSAAWQNNKGQKGGFCDVQVHIIP